MMVVVTWTVEAKVGTVDFMDTQILCSPVFVVRPLPREDRAVLKGAESLPKTTAYVFLMVVAENVSTLQVVRSLTKVEASASSMGEADVVLSKTPRATLVSRVRRAPPISV